MPPPPKDARPSRRRPALVAGAVVVLLAAVVTFALLATSDDEGRRQGATAKPTPPEWSQEAGRWLTSLPGLRYAGTMTLAGRPVQVRLTVTRAGLGTGRLTDGTVSADLVAIDGSTYVKGGTAFWRAYSGEAARAGSFAGRWAKVPSALSGLADVSDILGPRSIATRLGSAGRWSTVKVGTTPAYRVRTAEADYFVTTSAPYRLVRVRAAGQGRPQFAVSPLANTAAAFTELRPRVAALGGAGDPTLRFQPGKPDFVNCNDNMSGCTLSVDATLTSPRGTVPAGARAAMRATITAEGRTLGSCTGSAPVPAGRTVELRCKVTSPGWRSWLRVVRETPGPHPYEGYARVIGEAVAASDVDRLLDLVDREREQVISPSPSATPSSTP
ncbi:hypothetical protein [Actinomadura sp. SCN-SB]|uniref:hypothetical protein n=1 Tax=Actinomadura sp. SCN-SB TaxID=3373092 RepID=UPI00375210A8